jgi:proline racemase
LTVERLEKFSKSWRWSVPDHWVKISTVDVHTEGEPLRIILEGFPELSGETILARRKYARERYDHLRTAVMWEPRGHADMYGCLITPAVSPTAHFGVLFLHNEGFSTMCGHGIIGVTKAVLELGMIKMQEPVTSINIDTPAGLVSAYARVEKRKIKSVYFHNVPSFVVALEQVIEVAGLGAVKYDLAFGGAFYACVQVEQLGLKLTSEHLRLLIETGMQIKRAIMRSREIPHPVDTDLSFLYGTIFIGPAQTSENNSRHVCIFAEGEVDRSPTGTGVSARMAIHYARGEITINQPLRIESIIGTRFIGRVVKTTTCGPYQAIIPEVEGTAYITGRHEFLIDPTDPLKYGFILR